MKKIIICPTNLGFPGSERTWKRRSSTGNRTHCNENTYHSESAIACSLTPLLTYIVISPRLPVQEQTHLVLPNCMGNDISLLGLQTLVGKWLEANEIAVISSCLYKTERHSQLSNCCYCLV